MKRGDVVTVAIQGDYGKPRPAIIVQSDLFHEHPSITIVPLTSNLRDTPLFRVDIEPSPGNRLRIRSQAMIDKTYSIPREKVGKTIGHLDQETLLAITRALATWFGFA